jgi:hypothetical protein
VLRGVPVQENEWMNGTTMPNHFGSVKVLSTKMSKSNSKSSLASESMFLIDSYLCSCMLIMEISRLDILVLVIS